MAQVFCIGGDIPVDAVYVGRPTKWQNPFVLKQEADREAVIERFRQYLREQPALVRAIRRELRGRDLICWCAPKPCHADVLVRVAAGEEP